MSTAILVAGGRGRRLAPLTDTRPKALLPVGGRPLLGRWLDALWTGGFTDVRLALGHRAAAIEQFAAGRRGVTCHREPEPRGTAGVLREVGPLRESALVVFADIATDADPAHLLSIHRAAGNDLTLFTAPVTSDIPYGVVDADATGRVRGFVEKPQQSVAVHAGLYACTPATLEFVPPTGRFDFDALVARLLDREQDVRAVALPGRWIDIGTPANLARAQVMFGDAGRSAV